MSELLDVAPWATVYLSPEYSCDRRAPSLLQGHDGRSSLRYRSDASSSPGDSQSCPSLPPGGASPRPSETGRRCGWCRSLLEQTAHPDARWCSKKCRQTAWRARRFPLGVDLSLRARIAIADPPYPGTSRKYYSTEPTYRGEVDHRALVAVLAEFDGWVLATSQKALRTILPLCPEHARVGSWGKPIGVPSTTRGPHNCWEPIIYVPARRVAPGVRDFLSTQPARGGGTLPGRKPIKWVQWVLRLLGAQPGDLLFDLYPGTGIVGRVWSQLSPGAVGVSLRARDGVSPEAFETSSAPAWTTEAAS